MSDSAIAGSVNEATLPGRPLAYSVIIYKQKETA